MTDDEIKQAAILAGCWAIPGKQTGSSQQHNEGLIKLVRAMIGQEKSPKACKIYIKGIEQEEKD